MGIIKLKDQLKRFDIRNITKYLLIVFFAIQPLLEIILNVFSDDYFSIFGISIATLIRYGLIAVIVLSAILLSFNRKITKVFIGYLIVVAAFIIFQWYNLKGFNCTLMGVNLQKSLFQTALYISRYVIPMCLLYVVYVLKLNWSDFKKIILFTSLFVTVSMIASNLMQVDSISYSFDAAIKPEGTIISWFTEDLGLNWKLFTSRGMFCSGNELSALLTLLLPIVLWIALKSKKIWCFIVAAIQLIAMLMLGTRVAVYGSAMLCVGVICIWTFDLLFNKKKLGKEKLACLVAVLCLFAIVFVQSPFFYRIENHQASIIEEDNYPTTKFPDNPVMDEDEEKKPNEPAFEELEAEIVAQKYWIPLDIICENYKFDEHVEFWKYVVSEVEFVERDTAREIKVLILEDILFNKNSKLDKFVGIGEVPIYPEMDFISQEYYIGTLGILLFVIPYLIIIAYAAVTCIIRFFKKKFCGLHYIILMSLVFICFVAYVAGHTFEPLLVNTYISLLCSLLVLLLTNGDTINNEE